jgi:Predicted membrane protein involved in D-alanine export
MIFNSVTFIVFLVLVVTLYWTLPHKGKMWLLFVASCAFYGFWRWEFLPVMFASAITDYFVAKAIQATPVEQKSKRRWLLALTLFVNLGLLCYFKYLHFITDNTNTLLAHLGVQYHFTLWDIVLPFGISFYTFETVSYTIDVYRGLIPAERNLLHYSLFVTFFPKLVAGPIQRAGELLPQLKTRPVFQLSFIAEGLKRILYGLFLKVCLADNISPFVDEGFAMDPSVLSAVDVWTLAFLFGFQIYFDFSAYSHIAVGAAKMMGITIPENFNFPYISSSFKEFWKRWHISLSSWIRDYLYLPLSGIKVVKATGAGGIGEGLDKTEAQKKNTYGALFLTWMIMGFWHGANWTFLCWGIYHATLIFGERLLKPFRMRYNVNAFWGWCVTLPLAMLSWILFRARGLSGAFEMMGKVFNPLEYHRLNLRENNYIIAALLMVVFLVVYVADKVIQEKLERYPVISFSLNVVKYSVIALLVFTFLRPISQFIYFQF